MNPFRYGCVVDGENFCGRPELQRQLKELLKSGQNIVVQGPRRMGKTSLVCETVKSIRKVKMVYVDLFCVKTVGDFCRRTVAAVSKCGGRSFLDRTAELIRSLRPVIALDRDTGEPSITVDVKAARGVESVEEVMDMVAEQSKRVPMCIVFDEFQDVVDLPDSDVVIAALRAKIQFLPAVPFVFLGSVRNRMREIFDSPKSPFFKSAITFEVGEIGRDALAKFLVDRFRIGERRASEEVVGRIIAAANGISGDVQELCETTWLVTERDAKLTLADVERGIEAVFMRESRAFGAAISKLTAVQLNVLKGLAEEKHPRPYSGDFLSEYGLKNVGSVTKALKRLMSDELIYEHQGSFEFENPFFREWLRRR